MTQQRPTLIQLLRSNTFAVWIAIASVIVQSFHSFYAFYKISSLNGTAWGIAQGVLFALIVDAAVLFYTVRKNTKVTWMAAFVMVLINLYVYYTHLGLTFDFILGILISFVIPVSNYFYSEEIDDTMEVDYEDTYQGKTAKQWRDDREKLAEIIGDREGTIKQLTYEVRQEKDKATKYITELREEIKSLDELLKRKAPQTIKELDQLKADLQEAINNREVGKYEDKITVITPGHPQSKGFASLKSPAQEEQPPADKSLLNIEKIIHTDRPNPTE